MHNRQEIRVINRTFASPFDIVHLEIRVAKNIALCITDGVDDAVYFGGNKPL